MSEFGQKYLRGLIVPIGFIILIVMFIIAIGTSFINAYQGGEKDRIDRPELWIGIGILLAVIGVMAILSRMPEDAGFLGKEVAIGDSGIWEGNLPPVDITATMGPVGTKADLAPGYTLYARSGALAHVNAIMPGGVDYGRKFSGMLYAEGVKSASKEMWIPYEAVVAVYPESKAAFLAISGDETEALGWTNPPEGMTRGENKKKPASDRVK